MKIRFFSFLLLLSTSTLCLGQTSVQNLIEKLENHIDQKSIPGLMVSIVSADTTLFVGGIGYANIEKGERVSDQHLFRLGSVSKTFTAMGLYKLLDQSPFTLNTPIRVIDADIPFTNRWSNTHPVRVSHVLEHTSGFEDFHLHAIYNRQDSLMPPAIQMVEGHTNSLFSRWQPGTKKAYSNPNYIVAGHLIEAISKEPFAEYVSRQILEPMGMESSGYYFKRPKVLPFAQEYQRTGSTLSPIPFASINGSPAGDFCANASDMADFLQFMLNRDSSLFSHQEYERIESPKTSIAARNGLAQGYGLGNYTIWKNGYLFHGHGGQIDGFTARYLYSREANLGVSVAMNRNGDANAVADLILDLLLGEEIEAAADRKTFPIPDELRSKYAGFYEFSSPRNNLLAFSDRMFAGLTLDFHWDYVVTRTILGKAKDTLHYAGNNQFYLNRESAPSILLIDAPDKPVLWINDNYTEMASHSWRLIIFFGLLLSIFFMAIFMVHSLWRLICNLFRKQKRTLANHWVLSGAGACAILMFLGFGLNQPSTSISFPGVLMLLSSYAMVILSGASVYHWFKLPKAKGFFKTFYMLTTLGALTLSFYFWDIGFVGLKLWSY